MQERALCAAVPDILESDEYESAALFWIYREIKRLNETLQAAGIPDEAKRREICEGFFFDLQEGLTHPVTTGAGVRFTPLLVLITEDGRHLRATEQFDFHEYAHAIVAEYYENPHPE
jgi:hypothetical protein